MVFLHSDKKGLIAEYGTNNSINIIMLCYHIIKRHITLSYLMFIYIVNIVI